MKKFVSVILAAALLLMCSVCFAEGETVLRAGTNPEFAPFEYVVDSGEVEGIDVDIINEFAKDLGVSIIASANFRYCSFVQNFISFGTTFPILPACLAGLQGRL